MALDINGYNETFKAFVDFAEKASKSLDGKKAIARASIDVTTGALAGREVKASDADSVRGLFKWFRSSDDKTANNTTRQIFKDAIIDIFGGESKIPPSVKKAMLIADYDCGKPLTARRIMAVKQAIDESGVAKARSAQLKLETFVSPDVEQAALGMGYMKSELPKLARAAHFYAEAKGVSEMDAMREVGRTGSEANRLMQYGGRFLENAENFADGLRLISKFSEWHDDLSSAHARLTGKNPDYGVLDTPTKINAYSRAAKPDAKLGLERFIFEDIATNPAFNLKETDAERAFGVEHNPTSRHMIVADNVSVVGTLANIPPEKRRVVFAAFNAFQTFAPSAERYKDVQKVGYETQFLARILRHLPKLEAIMAKGPLTGRDIIKTCFPDIRNPGDCDINTIKKWEDDSAVRFLALESKVRGTISPMLENAGATIDEALSAVRKGKTLPTVPFYSDAQYSIGEASSFVAAGLATMNGDICRLSPYTTGKGDDAQEVFPGEQHAWKFNFPDGERLETNFDKQANIPRVGQKIRDLCGEVHQKQIGMVAYLLSQSGVSILKNQPLAEFGISTNEHSPVNFALSRNAETGAVTITYTSPKELPVKFSWTATVGVDGSVTSTPFVIDKPVARLDERTARTIVDGAIAKLGVGLDDARKNEAVQLLRKHGTNMYRQNAQLFAKFIVNLVNQNVSPQAKTAMVAATAASIREWRDFSFGNKDMAVFAHAAQDVANAVIRDYMQPGKAGNFKNDIFDTMLADANRATFIFNGTVYEKTPAAELIPAFKAVVPDPAKQKALSSWLNQLCFNTIMTPSMGVKYTETGVDAIKLPGAGALANRNMTTGTFMNSLLDTYGHDIVHDLQVSPDGKTATITQTMTADLSSPGSQMNKKISFGQVTLSQRLVIDLTAEIPTVTDFKISQEIDW
jgi:hypothetical protein